MRTYLRELPHRDLVTRRRFVIVATAVSFGTIILAWFILTAVSRSFRGTRESPTPSAATSTPFTETEPSGILEDFLAPAASPTAVILPSGAPTRAPFGKPSVSPDQFIGL